MRRTGEDGRAIEISTVVRSDRVQFFFARFGESLRRVDHPNGNPQPERIVAEVSVSRIKQVVLPFVRQERIENGAVARLRENEDAEALRSVECLLTARAETTARAALKAG